ncbi:MAG: TrbG/VirB9 family P-type conjugative transfer protein [Acidobacteriota bacterium]|nr:TrbG/VirB9 family P-type conjugative transfer protein [Acidobacteriota bacterium]
MKLTNRVSYLSQILLCGSLMAAPGEAAKRTTSHKPPAPEAARTAPALEIPSSPAEPAAKVVPYGDKDVVKVKTKLRYTTLIVLPKNEQILDFTCGDKEYWVVNGSQNFAYIKPAKAGSQTNLNLVTASGNIYSFVLSEISEVADAVPDLKVFVELKEESMVSAATAHPKFVSAQVADDYRQQIEIAKEETRQVKQASQAAIDSGVSKFLANVRFPYRFEAGKKPFFIRAMYHDDKFTFIQARPEETPTLYEIQDGKPNLVNFEYKNGVYVIEKILDQGYLAIGKQKLGFTRAE